VEARVVDEVLGRVALVRDQPLESMTPEDLVGQIGRPRLRRHSRRLDDAFQDDDQLEQFLLKSVVPDDTETVPRSPTTRSNSATETKAG